MGDRPSRLTFALAVLTLVQTPVVVLWALQARGPVPRSAGTILVETQPAGLEVRLDGEIVGTAPLTIPAAAGERTIEVRYGDVVRALPLTLGAGETVRQRFEFLAAPPGVLAAATTGSLQILTTPSPATILVDGRAAGTSPLSLTELAPGPHTLTVRFPTGTVERHVDVQPGATSSVQIDMPPPPGALSGWVAVDVPASLKISENGRLLGTTDVDRLMLPVGDHVLDIASDELGFRTQRTIRVAAGAVTAVPLELPVATLSINARPWAEVWVGGERVGETPIGNLSRPIGRYEVLLRHPQFGERRESVLVTLNHPARVSVDLRPRP